MFLNVSIGSVNSICALPKLAGSSNCGAATLPTPFIPYTFEYPSSLILPVTSFLPDATSY